MLSGYDLLDGDVELCPKCDRSLKHRLLEQSKKLADRMKFTFNTPSGIPHNEMSFTDKDFNEQLFTVSSRTQSSTSYTLANLNANH